MNYQMKLFFGWDRLHSKRNMRHLFTFLSLLFTITLIIQDVGIGTTSPLSKLHVKSDSGGDLLRLEGPSPFLSFYENGILRSYLWYSSNILYLNNNSNEGIYFRNDNKNAMVINSAQNVGIGTTSPSSRLHLIGGIDASLSGGGYHTMGPTSGLNLVMDNNEIMARNNGVASDLTFQNEGGRVIIGSGPYGTNDRLHIEAETGEHAMRIRINDATKMRVHSNGGTSIGINEGPPANGLVVQGSINPKNNINSSGNMEITSPSKVEIIVGNNKITVLPNGGITITSTESITLDAVDDINLNAGKNINITADNNLNISSGGKLTLTGDNEVEVNTNSLVDMNSSGNIDLTASSKLDLVGGSELELNSSSLIDVNSSGSIDMNSGGKLDLVGGTELELNSSAFIDMNASTNIDIDAGTDFDILSTTMDLNSSGTMDIDGGLMLLDAPNIHLNGSNGGLTGAARVNSVVNNPPCAVGCVGLISPAGSSGSVKIGN